jgi:WD40 repeat protein
VTTIGTLSSIGNMIWRPGFNQLATVGTSNDFDVHVWSLAKPYIPLASVEFHTDICKGICFTNIEEKSQYLVSCGMDGRVAQFDLRRNVTFPYKKLRSSSLSWNAAGSVGIVYEEINRSASPNSSDLTPARRGRHRRNLSDGVPSHPVKHERT